MFHSDLPIKNKDEDLLDRSNFAVNLSRTILDLPKGETYCIGLSGRWGSGKSSIINILIDEFSSPNIPEDMAPIIIKFEPWNFSNTENLLGQFFISLRNAYSTSKDIRFKKIGEAIEKYSGAFDLEALASIGGRFSPIVRIALHVLGQKINNNPADMDISKQKEAVVSLMEKENRKTIIIIDDIDRLSNEQIRQVFQLVTAVAKFPNTIYILSFDRNVVVRALEKVQDCNGDEYLEKIIQMPIEIPDIKRHKMEKVLFYELDKVLNQFPEIKFDKLYWSQVYRTCVMPFIKTVRDIKRLSNVLKFKMAYVSTEINPVDMIALATLEISNPKVFNWVKENKTLLTGSNTWLIMAKAKDSTAQQQAKYSDLLTPLVSKDESMTQDESTALVLNSISMLFPPFARLTGFSSSYSTNEELRRENRIAHKDKFDRYFVLDLNDVIIREGDISRAISEMPLDELISFFHQINKNGDISELLEEIRARKDFISPDRAKTIVQALFSASNDFASPKGTDYIGFAAYENAGYLLQDIAGIIPEDERYTFFKDILKKASLDVLQVFSGFLNTTELAHGRLAANGEERRFNKLVNLEELTSLERDYIDAIKSISETQNLLTAKHIYMLLYLMECFDPIFTEEYLNQAFLDDRNILLYARTYLRKMHGNETVFYIDSDYEKYFSTEKLLEAVKCLIDNKTIFHMPKDAQDTAATLILLERNKCDYRSRVSAQKAEELKQEW